MAIFMRQRRIIKVHTVVCTYFARIANIGGRAPQNMVLSWTDTVFILAAGHMCNWFCHRAVAGLGRFPCAGHGVVLFVSVKQRPLAASAAAVVHLWHRIPRVLDPSVAVIVVLLVRLLIRLRVPLRAGFNINPLGVNIDTINILEISSKLILIILIFSKQLSD